MKRSLLLSCALSSWLLGGCAASLSTLQTAQTLEPRQVQVEIAGSVPISTSAIAEIIDAGATAVTNMDEAAQGNSPLSADDQRQALQSALALVLFTPGVVMELQGRIGLGHQLDFGLRYASPLIRGDLKWQLVDGAPGLDLALDLAYSYHLSPGASVLDSVSGLADYVGLGDYSRHDGELGLLLSRDYGEVFRWYGSLRWGMSAITLSENIEKVETATGQPHTSIDNTLMQVAGSFGMYVGYKYVFLNLELSLARVWFKPTLLGEEVDLGGWIISPALGVMGKF